MVTDLSDKFGAMAAFRARLADRRRALSDEISSYPTPIAGCDAQFNGLLDERRRIDEAIGLVDRAAGSRESLATQNQILMELQVLTDDRRTRS